MMMAAARAPTSGRARTRLDQPSLTRLVGSSDGAGAGASMVWLMAELRSLLSGGAARHEPAAPPRACPAGQALRWLARVVLGERDDLVDVGLVDERRAGQHGLAATDVVAVLDVEVE